MRNFKRLSASFFFVLLLVVSAFGWQFAEECVLTGTVEYFGDSERSGLWVKAFIYDHEVASCKTDDGLYELTIPPDNPTTPGVKEGYEEGDPIVIMVDGIRAAVVEASGGVHLENLVVSASDVPNLTTWGKIKALFK
ncbi:MAG: hypothetical protein WBC88_03645 [Candidatus Zixiibacteriota bacterium]